jgi:hypothetical protein
MKTKRKKRLGELLEPPRSMWIVDLSAAIHRLEFGKYGRKVVYRTAEEQIENDGSTFSTFTTRWKDVQYIRDRESGGSPQYFVSSFPERMEVQEWTRMYQAWAARDRRHRSDFMDDEEDSS